MGWVEARFRDRLAYIAGLPALWHSLRDSVGLAKTEFDERTSNLSTVATLVRKDCTARGKYCLRLQRGPDQFIEIFLDEEDSSLKTSLGSADPARVCGYRRAADEKALEFFTVTSEGPKTLSAEDACERALADFIFNPFPAVFKDLEKGTIIAI